MYVRLLPASKKYFTQLVGAAETLVKQERDRGENKRKGSKVFLKAKMSKCGDAYTDGSVRAKGSKVGMRTPGCDCSVGEKGLSIF